MNDDQPKNTMTSSAAATRFCPISMASGDVARFCVGLDCMAWRNDVNGYGHCGMAGNTVSAGDVLPLLKLAMDRIA